jgi:tetratricopeptide (TPR) repeat protein
MRLALAFFLFCLPVPAAAQWPGPAGEPTEREIADARELYQRGTEQVEAHEWTDALESFAQSYELSGASVALYSLAYTLRVLGRYREAREAFSQLLGDHDDLEPAIRRDASALQREVAARVAILRLAGLPFDQVPAVLLDGTPVDDDGARPLPIEADPGERALRVEAPGYEPFTWQGTVVPGEDRTIDVSLEEAGGGLTSSPVFLIAVGVGVVAAGIIVGVILYQGAQLDQRTDHGLTL